MSAYTYTHMTIDIDLGTWDHKAIWNDSFSLVIWSNDRCTLPYLSLWTIQGNIPFAILRVEMENSIGLKGTNYRGLGFYLNKANSRQL